MTTNLERQIRSQPDALDAAAGLPRDPSTGAHRRRGTPSGPSHLAGRHGLQPARRRARRRAPRRGRPGSHTSCRPCSSSPRPRVIGPARFDRRDQPHRRDGVRARRPRAGLRAQHRHDHDHPPGAGLPHSIETVPKETSETYTASYTATLFVLALLAKDLGADTITDELSRRCPMPWPRRSRHPGIDGIDGPEAAAGLHRPRASRPPRPRESAPEVPGGGADRRRRLRRGVPAARPGRPAGRARPPRRPRPSGRGVARRPWPSAAAAGRRRGLPICTSPPTSTVARPDPAQRARPDAGPAHGRGHRDRPGHRHGGTVGGRRDLARRRARVLSRPVSRPGCDAPSARTRARPPARAVRRGHAPRCPRRRARVESTSASRYSLAVRSSRP